MRPSKKENPSNLCMWGEHGAERYSAILFSDQLRRGNPELYTVAIALGAWRIANVDICDGTYEGIRMLLPMMTDTADRGDMMGAIHERAEQFRQTCVAVPRDVGDQVKAGVLETYRRTTDGS